MQEKKVYRYFYHCYLPKSMPMTSFLDNVVSHLSTDLKIFLV